MDEGPVSRRPGVRERYGIDQHSEARTGEEVRQDVLRDLSRRFGPFAVLALLLEGGRVDDVLDAQAAQLKDGVMTRSAPESPDANYLGIPHQRLYEGVNTGGDPGVVGEMADIWTTLGNELATFNDDIAAAIGRSEADWVGKSGDKARQALADIGNMAGETGRAAQLAGTLFTQQSRALSTAKASVPPPPAQPFDPEAANERLMSITDPVTFAQQAAADRAAFQRQREDHLEAARAVETYDRVVSQTAAAQPAFAPAPEAPPQPSEPTPRPQQAGDDSTGRGFTPPPAVSGTTDTSSTSLAAPVGDGTTAPSGLAGGPQSGGQGGVGSTPVSGTPGTGSSGGFVPLGAGKGTQGRPGGRSAAGGASGTGRGGTGGVAGRPGGGVSGGGVPGGGAGAAKGGASGVLPGDTAGRRAASTGNAAGGRGAVGVGGVPGVAAPARGPGDEDVEHQTPSYLLEPDPDKVFGTSEATAPPVIGDWDQ
jgi:hypothetical protein